MHPVHRHGSPRTICRERDDGGTLTLGQRLERLPDLAVALLGAGVTALHPLARGDGFGLGWYGYKGKAGLYHSIRPAWNDFNLRDLAAQIETPLFMAHVRAAIGSPVQETNCHPFRHENWLWAHNGAVREYNSYIRSFPQVVTARVTGAERKEPFQPPAGSEQAPNVDFGQPK